jgi:hypothetical protein
VAASAPPAQLQRLAIALSGTSVSDSPPDGQRDPCLGKQVDGATNTVRRARRLGAIGGPQRLTATATSSMPGAGPARPQRAAPVTTAAAGRGHPRYARPDAPASRHTWTGGAPSAATWPPPRARRRRRPAREKPIPRHLERPGQQQRRGRPARRPVRAVLPCDRPLAAARTRAKARQLGERRLEGGGISGDQVVAAGRHRDVARARGPRHRPTPAARRPGFERCQRDRGGNEGARVGQPVGDTDGPSRAASRRAGLATAASPSA